MGTSSRSDSNRAELTEDTVTYDILDTRLQDLVYPHCSMLDGPDGP